MLKGIDISSHQGDINLAALKGVDFVIVKATEGTGYVNPYCDAKYQQAKSLGKCLGFYHFAGEGNATAEADYFVEKTRNYFGEAIPVLDWEGNQNVAWVNEFVRRVHDKMGVWCWIYGNPWRFNQGGVEDNCGRWVASYPNVLRPTLDYDPGDVPTTLGLVCAWQYASDGNVSGYNGNLDVSHFYGDKATWGAYATGDAKIEQKPVEKPTENGESVLENGEYIVTIKRK